MKQSHCGISRLVKITNAIHVIKEDCAAAALHFSNWKMDLRSYTQNISAESQKNVLKRYAETCRLQKSQLINKYICKFNNPYSQQNLIILRKLLRKKKRRKKNTKNRNLSPSTFLPKKYLLSDVNHQAADRLSLISQKHLALILAHERYSRG